MVPAEKEGDETTQSGLLMCDGDAVAYGVAWRVSARSTVCWEGQVIVSIWALKSRGGRVARTSDENTHTVESG
nr:hypothetical protein CFP56_64576 [Quercus suber]